METIDFGRVLLEKDGPIGRVILNWPEKSNAQDSKMVWAFDNALKDCEKDYDIKVVIIKANGKGFSAGHIMGGNQEENLPEFAAAAKGTGLHYRGAVELFQQPVLYLWEFPKPTIAQVHGYAVGAGSYWAMIPDITIASEDAFFQMPLPQAMGFPTGETMMEPWVFMNYKRTAEYMYQSKTLSAQQALEWGAINQMVPRDELEDTVEEIAANIAQAPLITLMMTKSLIKRAWEMMGLRVHWQMSTDLLELTAQSEQVREHMARMREKSTLPRKAVQAQEIERKKQE
jgi:enoyl-CoA hydratase